MMRTVLVVAVLAAIAGAAQTAADRDAAAWRTIGQDPANGRDQPLERAIGVDNVHRLALKWMATTAGDVSATPAVVNGAVYFGDFGGMLSKLDADTGAVIWSRPVSDYTGIAGDIARQGRSHQPRLEFVQLAARVAQPGHLDDRFLAEK